VNFSGAQSELHIAQIFVCGFLEVNFKEKSELLAVYQVNFKSLQVCSCFSGRSELFDKNELRQGSK
jgi:hypothetical protein